jgi:SNF2 family DNA or RNA helicase
MNFADFFKSIISSSEDTRKFEVNSDSENLFLLASQAELTKCKSNQSTDFLTAQFTWLEMLAEQGYACRLKCGYEIPAGQAVRLDDETRKLLLLPQKLHARFEVTFKGLTENSDFELSATIILPDGDRVTKFSLDGPILSLGSSETYLPNIADWAFLDALTQHKTRKGGHTRYDNLATIEAMQEAKAEGCSANLMAFDKINIASHSSIKVQVEKEANGSLTLTPDFGTNTEPKDFDKRKGQLDPSSGKPHCLNIGDEIVLLNPEKMAAVQEIMGNRRIAPDQVKVFLENPTAFLNASLVDLDVGYSVRVKGVTEFKKAYFGETDANEIDWINEGAGPLIEPVDLPNLIHTWDDYEEFEESYRAAVNEGYKICQFKNTDVHVEDVEAVNAVLQKTAQKLASVKSPPGGKGDSAKIILDTDNNDEVATYGSDDTELVSQYSGPVDLSNLKYQPYPYQEKGIRWILSHAFGNDTDKGSLLADDMGLGKTFMSLVAIQQFYIRQKENGVTLKPTLIVCPLSLVENWQDEVDKFFTTSPFTDIVLLQALKDLKKFRQKGARSETAMNADALKKEPDDAAGIKYALKVGTSFGPQRLDMPGRLVITTYETLRDYMFSLGLIDWSFIIFDEAQKIKSPNTIATKAAVALKGQFKLLVSGTPVENSLKDFWCLFDIAKPGFLGAYQAFRKTYMQPIATAKTPEERAQAQYIVGKALREKVSNLMLRRTKEEELEGMPAKIIYTGIDENRPDESHAPFLAKAMSGKQLTKYDSVLTCAQVDRDAGKLGATLKALHGLRTVSLHPDLGAPLPAQPFSDLSPLAWLKQSVKLQSVLETIDRVQERGEKVILFLIDKRLQLMLKLALCQHYGLTIHVINGDAPAISSKNTLSRKGLIADFEKVDGFNIIIMSPVAAGVGLTVVGANHVIHLERHWNPAKEAQATDRAYRIGQEREVSVYIPIAVHPEKPSFDQNLNRLLSKKIDLKDAVVTTEAVASAALADGMLS